MKTNKANSNSLKDFLPIEEMTEDGIALLKGGAVGFHLELRGLDPSFYDDGRWASVYELWRPLLKLLKDEEIQIVFSKRGDFEDFLEARFQELKLVKNAFTRRLFLQ